MSEFKTTVKESSKSLSAKEKVKLKDVSSAIKLDEAVTPEEALTIDVVDYAIIGVHNEKSENPDYDNYIFIDDLGQTYVTGSDSLFRTFKDIWDDMEGEEEDWSLKIYKQESKNFRGKYFLTCTIV